MGVQGLLPSCSAGPPPCLYKWGQGGVGESLGLGTEEVSTPGWSPDTSCFVTLARVGVSEEGRLVFQGDS